MLTEAPCAGIREFGGAGRGQSLLAPAVAGPPHTHGHADQLVLGGKEVPKPLGCAKSPIGTGSAQHSASEQAVGAAPAPLHVGQSQGWDQAPLSGIPGGGKSSDRALQRSEAGSPGTGGWRQGPGPWNQGRLWGMRGWARAAPSASPALTCCTTKVGWAVSRAQACRA